MRWSGILSGWFFFYGTPIRKQIYLFQPPPTKTCNQRQEKDPVHLVGFSPWVHWDVCSVYQKADEQYILVTTQLLLKASSSGTYQPIFPDDVLASSPATARCRIRTTQSYQGLFLVPFFQADSAFSLLPSSPPNKTKHVCRSSNTLCISLYHFHIPHLQVFPSLGQKVTCVFSVKHPRYRSHNHAQRWPLYKSDSVTYLSPRS